MKIFRTLEPEKVKNLLVLFISGLCFWTSLTTLLPTLPAYIQDIGGTTQEVGLVMGSFAIGLLLFRRVLGNIADRRSRKLVVLIGTAVVGLAPLCYLIVDSIPLLMVARAFHGISIAAFTIAYSTLVVDVSPPQQRGELIGYMSLVAPIGMALGPALGGFLAAGMGYNTLFLVSSVLGLLAFICALQVKEALPAKDSIGDKNTTASSPPQKFWQLLTSPRLRIPAVVMLMVGLIFGTMITFLPLYIGESELELNPGLFYTAAAIASFAIRLFTGRASDRYGRGIFITGSLVCYGVAMLLLAVAQNAPTLLIAGIFEGAAAGTILPMMIALLSDRSQAYERGQIYAICIGGFDLGMAIAGPTFGSIIALIGYRGLFFFAASLAGVAFFIFLTLSSKNLSHSIRFATGQEKDLYALTFHQS